MNALLWIVPSIAVLGVIGQWGVGAFWVGRVVQRVDDHDRRFDETDVRLERADSKIDDHGRRIAWLEGRKHGQS